MDYIIHCQVDNTREEHLVQGVADVIIPAEDAYVHIDLELADIHEEADLKIEVTTDKVSKPVTVFFDQKRIQLFHDGNHLHLTPFLFIDLFGNDYILEEGESDSLRIMLYRDGNPRLSIRIPIRGLWRRIPLTEKRITASELLEELDSFPGWNAFKQRLQEMVTFSHIEVEREKVGIPRLQPLLHTIIIGNNGTGKTSCVKKMATLYKTLGFLDTDTILTTKPSMLATSRVNGEYEELKSFIENAQGGTLVFENAHNLFHTENKNYDTEQALVRGLIDALENENNRRWMLVLIGEPEGMESLLAANPDLKKHFSEPIYLEDFKPEELYIIAERYAASLHLHLSDSARQKLEMFILHKYNHRGTDFQNAWIVQRLFNERIVPAMYGRLKHLDNLSEEQLGLVLAEDIPAVNTNPGAGMEQLEELIGLGKIKTKIKDYLNAVRLAGLRMEVGLPTSMPRLHMAFLGNPGTGKTTVAEIIGHVFASWGILSEGRVIRTEKSQMVGRYIGETESKMRQLLERAHGNILFIDEAYQLVEGGERDFGRIVMNSLLTELGRDNLDMVVIIAGYTAPMKRLMESNEGIESRFPNVFNFEDYSTEELLEIGKMMIRRQGFTLSPGAEANMRSIIEQESEKPSPRFGNGRFVSNLLQNEILASLGARISMMESPTKEDLSTILPQDVVIGKAHKEVVFDDMAIDAALTRLDGLAGLAGVKTAIHNFVRLARYLHSIGEPYVGKGLLSWRFVGKSGTGKSTVAEIMASILKGMRLISNSHITQIKGERIFGVSEHDCDEVLADAVKRSCNGLIFIDMDAPKFGDGRVNYGRDIEQICLRVKEMTVEVGGECALVVAQLDAPNSDMAFQLSDSGVYDFDHTLIFKDFTPDELFDILSCRLGKLGVSFHPDAEKHLRGYLRTLTTSMSANARTMKLIARAIYQQVILREAALPKRPVAHQVLLEDVETFKWDGKRGKIGF